MKAFRKQFPVLKQGIYANTAMSGLLYDDLLEWRQGHDLDFMVGGGQMKFESMKLFPEIRKTLANFFMASKKEVALVPNFSLGLNLLLEGLPKNSNVLLLETDYPSVNWPVEDREFKVHYAKIDRNMEAHIYEAITKNDIDVFVFSMVQWVNGIYIDLDFLTKLKERFPDLLLLADGTQFCGMYEFDFNKSPIDVMGASGYKWLLGGYGNGFFLIKKEAQQRFSIKSTGNGSVQGDPSKRAKMTFCRHLEPGHLDTLNFGSLKFSLDFLHKIGMQHIAAHNQVLASKAKDGLAEIGLLEDEVVHRKQHSTIFNIKGDKALLKKLTQKGVFCSSRGDGIRLSFHFYNTTKEIDKIIKILKK